jgi:hypothetical protein
MRCEEVVELLPDYALGTLSETEEVVVRRHLRGCGACRADAESLDRGVAMFASAVHAVDPPSELKGRVMSVLSEEWTETPVATEPRARRFIPWLAVAAAVIALAGSLVWGAAGRSTLSQTQRSFEAVREDALKYRQFLGSLGGKEIRIGSFSGHGSTPFDGTAVLYDSDRGQSWALVLVTAPGYQQPIDVSLVSASGRTIPFPFPAQIDADGQGAAWLVTSADISSYTTVRLTSGGRVIATAKAT